jgi:hypothetical protein
MLPNEIGTLPGKTAIKPGNRPQMPKFCLHHKPAQKNSIRINPEIKVGLIETDPVGAG